MLIDWFTVVAQLINFAILVVALKYLLYDRILEAMDKRRQEFVDREEETRRLTREAEQEARRLEEERRKIEANWDDMIAEARREADDRRRELLAEARSAVETQEQQWRDSLRSRHDLLLTELQRETGEQATEITRRAFADLAHADIEAGMIREFVARIDALAQSVDDEMVDAVRKDADTPLTVCSAFEISAEQRSEIRQALRRFVGDDEREIEWELDRDLIAGIVVGLGARRIGWTIDTYLEGVRGRFADLMRTQLEEAAEEELSPDPGETETP